MQIMTPGIVPIRMHVPCNTIGHILATIPRNITGDILIAIPTNASPFAIIEALAIQEAKIATVPPATQMIV